MSVSLAGYTDNHQAAIAQTHARADARAVRVWIKGEILGGPDRHPGLMPSDDGRNLAAAATAAYSLFDFVM
jgi:hypothetical protein